MVLADVDLNACIKKAVRFFHEASCNYLPGVTFLFFSFSLSNAIEFLTNTEYNSDIESSSDGDDQDLAMLPQIEKADAETDMHSDESDDMNDGLVHHLPRRLLNSTCDSSLLDKGNKQKSVQRVQPPNQENQLQESGKNTLTYSQL